MLKNHKQHNKTIKTSLKDSSTLIALIIKALRPEEKIRTSLISQWKWRDNVICFEKV